jgi:hypothetical protein
MSIEQQQQASRRWKLFHSIFIRVAVVAILVWTLYLIGAYFSG